MEKALEVLAEKLGKSVEQLWPIAVRYVVTDAIVGLWFALVVLVGSWVATRWVWKKATKMGEGDSYAQSDEKIVKSIATALILVTSFACLHSAFQDLSHLLNPEGYLVKQVLDGVTK